MADVAASTSSRTPPSSTFSVLVSQAYPVHAHQTAARASAPQVTRRSRRSKRRSMQLLVAVGGVGGDRFVLGGCPARE
jgi:hypothetical protein